MLTWTVLYSIIMATQQKEQQSDLCHVSAIRDIVNIYSYNMRGFNQGCLTFRDLTASSNMAHVSDNDNDNEPCRSFAQQQP